ncbi:hypothetical protein CTI12_AA386870 [Artemisia annua]|uniref:Reverse transcriptase domain, Reverse transcriptase zinc-binding domain protein n=1 Tax=Artemisia annua TaxID=35608 RepID=A0A2U1LV63_ARTAN|nr:hypothetical protein CTI12_AA386870 [Artemisia annua]
MDRMTTSICNKPYGRASFARVLVEIDSSKALVDNVELWYESLGKILKLWVEYTWVPPRCEECKVYGHYLSECAKKVNTVSKVNKDGETVKPADVKQSNNNDGAKVDDGDEGSQTATRRNFRNTGNNYRQGQVGNYNVRRGGTSNRGGFNNRGNSNVSNVGVKDTSKSSEPINSGSVGHIDDSMVANDKGEPVNKGKSKINEGGGSNSGNSNGGIAVGGSETVDPWNDVKVKVANACNTNVPIEESVLKGWNADMVRFYSVKWNNRTRKSESVKQHFDIEMKSLSSQIAQISRNLDKNSKLNAEMKLKKADVNVQNNRDAYFRKVIWDNLKPLCKLEDLSHIWAETISGLSIKTANNSLWSVIQRLVFGAAVYYIWQERNGRIFRKEFRNKLMGLKIKKSREAVKAAVIWKILLYGVNGDGSLGYNAGIDGLWKCNKVFDRGEIGLTISYALQKTGLASALACFLVAWRLASYALQNRTRFSALAVCFCFWIMRCTDFHKYLVCCFCLGTGFWRCNQVFDCDDDDLIAYWCLWFVIGWFLYNWLCTTEIGLASALACFFGCWGYNRLCTTEPNLDLCAGLLFWIMRSSSQVCDTISYALQKIGLASALACLLDVWSIARYALQNRVRFSALAVLFWFIRSIGQMTMHYRGFFICQGFFNEIGYIWVMLTLDESPILMNASVVSNHKTQTTGDKPQYTTRRRQTTVHKPLDTNRRTQTAGDKPQYTTSRRQTSVHKPQDTNRRIQTTGDKPQETNLTNHRRQISVEWDEDVTITAFCPLYPCHYHCLLSFIPQMENKQTTPHKPQLKTPLTTSWHTNLNYEFLNKTSLNSPKTYPNE